MTQELKKKAAPPEEPNPPTEPSHYSVSDTDEVQQRGGCDADPSSGFVELSNEEERNPQAAVTSINNLSAVEARLEYARLYGWVSFPVPPGKKMSYKAGKHYGGRNWGMTKDPDEIRRDHQLWPDAGVGLPTGAVNNFIVIEADTLEGHDVDGIANLKKLEAELGPLPETLSAVSPSGSVHYYFKHPGGDAYVKNSDSELALGVDVKGDGGMVIAAPTKKPGGGAYRLANDKPVAELTEEWLALLLTQDRWRSSGVSVAVAAVMRHDDDSHLLFTMDVPPDLPEGTGQGISRRWEDCSLPEMEAALRVIPNDGNVRNFNLWNTIGLAIYAETGGSEEGFALFDAFSRRSSWYNKLVNTRERWEHFHRSPPNRIGANYLYGRARKVNPNWREEAFRIYAELETQKPDAEQQTESPVLRPVDECDDVPNRNTITQQPQQNTNQQPQQDSNQQQRAEGAGKYHYGVLLVRASDVVMRPKDWLWEGHLLRGALELLTGIPGIGKSQAQCDLVARATTGRPWPNGAFGIAPISVIMITAEDAIDQEVVPRLLAAGADLAKVHIVKAIKDVEKRQFLLSEDLDKIEKNIEPIGRLFGAPVGLITMDPITAYMGGKMDAHKVTEVRSQLGPLKDFAERINVAVSAVTHPAKNPGKRAIDHFIASQAFIGAARIGHACFEEVYENEDGEKTPTGRVLFTNPKNNPSAKMPTLAYRIVTGIEIGRDRNGRLITSSKVEWGSEAVDISADDALAAGNSSPRRDETQTEVRKFLRRMLSGSELVLQTQIMEEGKVMGFSEKQIRTAARRMNVNKAKEGFDGPWYWSLPL
jgi:hypothetical protein